ncbi:general vesicular transport factor p115 isoform X2 [Patella vulgata]|uniref:general vesicular transport factor p115 isoform X2 n=1 Tax=Patella vulgata TaxID=6465 RepID=UPI00217F6F17|nr:general vesicular transport factor p115 isoform X2 [Patella vulgata]
MDYLRNIMGAPQGGVQPTGAETVSYNVERLVDRTQSSTLLDDRRDAVRGLKALSKKYRLEVGTQAMDCLTKVLETDRGDAEIMGLALDTLCNVMSDEPTEEEDLNPVNEMNGDLGANFTEIYIKNPENVSLLLSLLEEYDFHVRWPTVKLLTILLTNKGKGIQECILVSPMGVSKLMDLLSDSREIIRNDALLLLIQLTKGNANIQKIVAFENAFERLLDIIQDEGNSDGGIVVEDCLLLLLNLLKNNSSNQNFFKEGSYIQKITPYFDLNSDPQRSQGGWSAQKVTNLHLMLQLVRTMVSPNNAQQQTTSCQKSLNYCGLLQKLCSILMASGVPADVLTETINTVSEAIRGNPTNQEYFASVLAPSNPPRPAIVVLLMSMVNEKQPFVLRCAVLYCFQSFLYKNEVGQSQIVQTLLPTTADVNTITAGQLLCGGLFSSDSLSNWFAAVAMLHAILENRTQKEQLLRVQLATSLGNPPVSLLQQCCNILAQGGKLQTRIGLLMLMCGWLSDCSIAVTHFLSNTANVPFLISQVSASEGDEQELLVQGLCAFLLGICMLYNDDQSDTFTKASLKQVIENRIGLETFNDKLSQILKNESYTRAAKKPNLHYKQSSEVIFDYAFTRIFKTLENEVLKSVSYDENSPDHKKKLASLKEHESIVDQYKEFIKEQDARLNAANQELESLNSTHTETLKQIEEFKNTVQQLKDQNALLKVQKGARGSPSLPESTTDDTTSLLSKEIENLKSELNDKNKQIDKLKNDLTQAEVQILSQENGDENKENNPNEAAVVQATLQKMNTDLERSLADRDNEISRLQDLLQGCKKEVEQIRSQQSQGNNITTDGDSQQKLQSLKDELKKITEEKTSLQDRVTKSNEENLKTLDRIRKLETEKEEILVEKRNVEEELDVLKKEQDDLLVLLADQEAKIDKYKTMLKDLGQDVNDDDDDDDLDDDDDDDDGDD